MARLELTSCRWRGGLNTWHTLPADKIFRLSKSFRFGSQLANVANTLIAYQNEEESLKGTSVPGEIYRPLKSMEFFGGEKWTMLFRSNEGACPLGRVCPGSC